MTNKITAPVPRKGIARRHLLCGSGALAVVAAAKAAFPGGAFAQGAGPEVKGTRLGYIALTDAAPLVIAKEKGFFAKHGVPDMDISKQASWGATRDNMALGLKANGIDGGHILRPKSQLYATGKVMQNNQPLPMYTLLNLNEDCQAISVSNEFKDLKVGTEASALKDRDTENARVERPGTGPFAAGMSHFHSYVVNGVPAPGPRILTEIINRLRDMWHQNKLPQDVVSLAQRFVQRG